MNGIIQTSHSYVIPVPEKNCEIHVNCSPDKICVTIMKDGGLCLFCNTDAGPFFARLLHTYHQMLDLPPYDCETLLNLPDQFAENKPDEDGTFGGCTTHRADRTGHILGLSYHSNARDLHISLGQETSFNLTNLVDDYIRDHSNKS